MEVGLLGPVTVPAPEGPATPGKRARALLAVLALAALAGDEQPSDEDLVGRAWPTTPPDPTAALAGVRAQLAAVLADGTPTTDAARFADLVRGSREAEDDGDLASAEQRLREALALWRGEALEDVRDTTYLQEEARRLTDLRLLALEDLFDLAVRQGRFAEVVDEVRHLVDEHPTRERLWALLLTALYRTGRRDEAVSAYAEARDTLADELGVEPGEALQQLQSGMLRNDPELGGQGDAAVPRPRARIPVLASSTYGREKLTAHVAAELTNDDVRLVTLTGIGGSGKSRVATLVATEVRPRFSDVVYLQVTEAIAAGQLPVEVALAVGVDTRTDLAESLATLGPDWRGLVVLDNLEALPEGPQVVHLLLESSAQLTVLVTSRLLLRLPGEREQPVPALVVPAIADDKTTIAAASSVQLFVDRATSAEPSFRLAGQEHDVAEVCALLDGLPLAIELAAARVKLLSLDRVIDGLRTNLDLLATAASTVPERQRAMTTAIQWSYDRLTADEQLVCDRLALFERGFTIEAVEAVCPDVPQKPGVVDALASIVDARLVRATPSRADVRFVVLGTVRAFARERLLARSDLVTSRVLLTAYLTGRAEDSRARLYGEDAELVQAQLDDDAADIAAAVEWSLDAGRRSAAVELLLASLDYWCAAGRYNEALGLTLRVLEHVPAQGPDAARLLAAATMLSHQLSDHDQARTYGRQALELAERHSDRASMAAARTFLGAELVVAGDLDDGIPLAEAGSAEAEALGLYPLARQALSVLAMAHAMRRDADGERQAYEAKLKVVRAKGDLAGTADTLNTLAEIAIDESDGAGATSFATEALAISARRLPPVARDATITLARSALVRGDVPEAAGLLEDALERSDRLGQALAVAQCLRVGGCLALMHRDAAAAVRLFAAAHVLSAPPGGGEVPFEQDLASGLTEARAELGEESARREWLLGTVLPQATIRAQLAAVIRLAAGANVPA